ncbi:MAG: class II aldolase/adducin family protein [Lachnospiraceae bacterium]|nr:class II aldolase/adducin family protein [Lachnospiraceae bacterium]
MAYTEDEGKALVVKAGKKLVESGLIARTWGNISARISDTQFVITPSGKAYETLTPEDIVTVNISDCSYESDIKPSSEKGVHAEAYRLRKDVNFVIHTHQTNASALSILGRTIGNVAGYLDGAEKILGPSIPCAEYGLSSTKKLKENVAAAIERHPDCNSVLMKYHGAICMGKDYDNAFSIAFTLEKVSDFRFREMCKLAVAQNEVTTANQEENKKRFYKVFEEAFDPDYEKRRAIYDLKGVNCIIYSHTPYAKIMASMRTDMKPYIDDLAQIAGTSIRCLKKDTTYGEIAKALKGRNAVLIEGVGALCVGANEDETEAVCMVLEKGAQAAVLATEAGNVSPISTLSAKIERTVYVAKYSKLK